MHSFLTDGKIFGAATLAPAMWCFAGMEIEQRFRIRSF
jgi:hypothetical protein